MLLENMDQSVSPCDDFYQVLLNISCMRLNSSFCIASSHLSTCSSSVQDMQKYNELDDVNAVYLHWI